MRDFFLQQLMLSHEPATNANPDKKRFKIKVKCITTGEVFESLKEAAKYTGVHATNIAAHLRGVNHYAGKTEIDGELVKMKWERVYD